MKNITIIILILLMSCGCSTTAPILDPLVEYIEEPITGIKKVLPWNWGKDVEVVKKANAKTTPKPISAKQQLTKDFSSLWLIWFISIGAGIALVISSRVMGKDFLVMGLMGILCGIGGPVLVYIAKIAAVWVGVCVVVVILLGLVYVVHAVYKKHKKDERHFGQLVNSFQASKGRDWEASKGIAQMIQDEDVQKRVKKHKHKIEL